MKKFLLFLAFVAALGVAYASGTLQRATLRDRAADARSHAQLFSAYPGAWAYFTGRAEAFEEASAEFER